MAKKQKSISKLEALIAKNAENYMFRNLIGHALANAILEDYAGVVAKIEGVDPDEVIERVSREMYDTLGREGWFVYYRQTEQGEVPALGIRWYGREIKTAPVPVLKMPGEVDGNEPPSKKKRKRYI